MIKDRKYEYAGIQCLEAVIASWEQDILNKTPTLLLEEVKLSKSQLEIPSPNLENINIRLNNRETVLMKYTFLLIGEKAESQWPLVLERALSSLGKLQMVSEKEVAQTVVQSCCDVIIIDAGVVRDAAGLVSFFREQHPEARIIVATASPTWQRAREMLQAGAADYIYKSLDEKRLQAEIRAVLDTPLSP